MCTDSPSASNVPSSSRRDLVPEVQEESRTFISRVRMSTSRRSGRAPCSGSARPPPRDGYRPAVHLAVGEAELAHHLHPADFEPDDEVRVIDHSHLVGLGVAHAQPGLVHLRLGRCRQRLAVGLQARLTCCPAEFCYPADRCSPAEQHRRARCSPSVHAPVRRRDQLSVSDIVHKLRRKRVGQRKSG